MKLRRRRRGNPSGCLPAAVALALGALALSYGLSPGEGGKAQAQTQERPSYLPPPRYTDPRSQRQRPLNPSQASRARAEAEAQRAAQTQQEYYAEDWIVVGPDGTVVCKDPYVRLAHKYIECISSEPVR